ncbi:hypothetical protein LTR24_008762 [Lithohypha guttulata]|uniref:Uncharacterized protein n=1 Tax=Lithohypha guttulata TaxID=1690604 RepID=A0ABR0JZ43_9EURO|nr:hypothetical protein LTR24_008762 [Lithohypha guttulata]
MSAHSSEPSSSRRREQPQLSPKDVQLPPSPPFDFDDDYDSTPSRPASTERYSEPSIPTKPILHQLPVRSQNQSPSTPMARPHTSTGLTPPLMQRAHSSPGVDSNGRFVTPSQYYPNQRRPASPLGSGRRRSPLRIAMEESYPVSWSGLAIEPNIPEHAELDLSGRLPEGLSQISPTPTYHNTFPRSRRRPTSPLHASASAPSLAGPRTDMRAISPHAGGTSSPQPRYYPSDAFPNSFGYSSASSMPSTPSSFRSRSPSISSLETIEDSPDAEEAARLAAEGDAKYRAELGDSGSESGDSRRRSSLDGRASSLRSNKERKRWSVCGAERRADFSLEPIEERGTQTQRRIDDFYRTAYNTALLYFSFSEASSSKGLYRSSRTQHGEQALEDGSFARIAATKKAVVL